MKETLEVTYKGKNIYDVLQMTIEEAEIFFKDIPAINDRLESLNSTGLQYLTLGQSATTLSGGEAQRIRLASQLGSQLVGALYVLDEPTIGLHQRDNDRLINTLKNLRDIGHTIIVVEHDEQVMRAADWIVEIGPAAGRSPHGVLARASWGVVAVGGT